MNEFLILVSYCYLLIPQSKSPDLVYLDKMGPND